MAALPAPAKAIAALDQISGRATPILAYLDRWKVATHLKGQSLDQAISRIKRFASTIDEPIERLTGRHVQVWIESMMLPSDDSKGYSADTLGNYLASLRTYWEYLQSHDIIPLDSRPFWNRKLQDRRNEVERAEQDRNRFEPPEVVKLWQKADETGDKPLAAAIRLAAYSGARREGVCALTVQSIRRQNESGIDFLHFAEKSRSGVRAVPIHSKIADLIKTLAKGADANGYLIHNTTINKYGKRGDNIGGRFSRMKAAMGYGGQHTFHSIRHTVIYLLRRAECPTEIRKNIVGHAPQGAHEGYGGVIDLLKKREWLEKAICYPE
jgi:integrase